MRGRRAFVTLGLTALLEAALVVAPPAAIAGGGSSLDFRQRGIGVGSTVVASSTLYSARGDTRSPADGPFFAYLLPAGSPARSIRPPHIPSVAIPLGLLQIRPARSDGWWTHVAVLRFVVPHVPTGSYTIQFCNDPCRSTTVGDLWGVYDVGIGQTTGEGRLAYRLGQVRFLIRRARGDAKDLRARVERLEILAVRETDAADLATAEAEGLRRAVERVNERAERAVAANARSLSEARRYRTLAIALAVALLLSVTLAFRSRRRPAPTVIVTEPESSPERELVGAGRGTSG